MRVEESETCRPTQPVLRNLLGLQNGLDDGGVESHGGAEHGEQDDVVGQGPKVVDLAHLLEGFLAALEARGVGGVADDAEDEDVPRPERPEAEGEDPNENANQDQLQQTLPGTRLPP